MTAFCDVMNFSLRLPTCNLELVVHSRDSSDALSNGLDRRPLLSGLDRSTQRDDALGRDDLHVFGGHGEFIIADDHLPNVLGDGSICLSLPLISGREGRLGAVPYVQLRVVRGWLRIIRGRTRRGLYVYGFRSFVF